MIDCRFAKLAPTIQIHAGDVVSPLVSSVSLIGAWDVRLSTFGPGNEIEFTCCFDADGTTVYGGEQGRWRIEPDGLLYLTFRTPPDPAYESTKQGGVVELRQVTFECADGRILLANEDASVVYVMTRASHST